MTLKANMETALANLFTKTGESVTYSGSGISAIVTYLEHNMGDQARGRQVAGRAEARIRVKKSDVSIWAYRDSIVIGSTTWRVKELVKEDWYSWMLLIESDTRPAVEKRS